MVSAEEFVKIWQQAESAAEVAEKCGINRGSAMCRASRMRKAGVSLKMMGGAPHKLDVAALSALAKKSLKKE